MITTRALVTYDAEDGATEPSFVMEELDVYEPEDDELLVRMVATGLCQTDITSALRPGDGTLRVLGHEGFIPCRTFCFEYD